MDAGETWLSGLLVALFGLVFFLGIKYPNASRTAGTTVVVSATMLFFLICRLVLGH
jgi:hypothetical protein